MRDSFLGSVSHSVSQVSREAWENSEEVWGSWPQTLSQPPLGQALPSTSFSDCVCLWRGGLWEPADPS